MTYNDPEYVACASSQKTNALAIEWSAAGKPRSGRLVDELAKGVLSICRRSCYQVAIQCRLRVDDVLDDMVIYSSSQVWESLVRHWRADGNRSAVVWIRQVGQWRAKDWVSRAENAALAGPRCEHQRIPGTRKNARRHRIPRDIAVLSLDVPYGDPDDSNGSNWVDILADERRSELDTLTDRDEARQLESLLIPSLTSEELLSWSMARCTDYAIMQNPGSTHGYLNAIETGWPSPTDPRIDNAGLRARSKAKGILRCIRRGQRIGVEPSVEWAYGATRDGRMSSMAEWQPKNWIAPGMRLCPRCKRQKLQDAFIGAMCQTCASIGTFPATAHTAKQKRSCHGRTCYAVQTGVIRRPKECSACRQTGKVLAAHDDWDNPLAVTWLCQQCFSRRRIV